MKKFLLLFLVLTTFLSLVSCSVFRNDGTSQVSVTTVETETAAPEQTPGAVVPRRVEGDPLTVCIDAGHGYTDPGCTSDFLGGVYESEITMKYAEELKSVLEGIGCRVIMLHTPDKFVTVDEIVAGADKIGLVYMKDKLLDDGRFYSYNRTVWANVLHRETFIDAFISVHINAFPEDKTVSGTRTYYFAEGGYRELSASLCESITLSVKDALPEQKPKYYAKNTAEAFVVNKHAHMPSALVEVGFATNKKDAENILDDEWRVAFVTAVAEGIVNYYDDNR